MDPGSGIRLDRKWITHPSIRLERGQKVLHLRWTAESWIADHDPYSEGYIGFVGSQMSYMDKVKDKGERYLFSGGKREKRPPLYHDDCGTAL